MVVVWRVLVSLYLAAAVAALVVVNADQNNLPVAVGVVAAASLALGWGTSSGWGVVMAWFLIPLALPFGDTNRFTGGGDTDAVVLLALVAAVVSTVLILAAAGARVVYNRRHPHVRPTEAQALGPPPPP